MTDEVKTIQMKKDDLGYVSEDGQYVMRGGYMWLLEKELKAVGITPLAWGTFGSQSYNRSNEEKIERAGRLYAVNNEYEKRKESNNYTGEENKNWYRGKISSIFHETDALSVMQDGQKLKLLPPVGSIPKDYEPLSRSDGMVVLTKGDWERLLEYRKNQNSKETHSSPLTWVSQYTSQAFLDGSKANENETKPGKAIPKILPQEEDFFRVVFKKENAEKLLESIMGQKIGLTQSHRYTNDGELIIAREQRGLLTNVINKLNEAGISAKKGNGSGEIVIEAKGISAWELKMQSVLSRQVETGKLGM